MTAPGTGPSVQQQIEATAALLVESILISNELEQRWRMECHRTTMLDAERHRLFTLLAEEQRAAAQPYMEPATTEGAGSMRVTAAVDNLAKRGER